MKEKTIVMESMTFPFIINENQWQLKLAKSQTHVQDLRQLAIIGEDLDFFVPVEISKEDDLLTFTFTVNQDSKKWDDICKLSRNDKLRLLCNVARFRKLLTSRITFFLHPDNLIFDENLIPSLVYRGIREIVPPYEINQETFLLQYKCLAIALFSKKYSFEDLYSGSWKNAKDTEFERQIGEVEDCDELIKLLENHYIKEKIEYEKNMQTVPKKRFRLFKQLSFIVIALAVILAIPLIYFSFIKAPFQEHLLEAHRHFLALDYGKVINDLQGEKPEKLPDSAKYILAYSYVKSEPLNESEKEVIMKNVSLKSDENYLLYWIYNGRGDFESSVDYAKNIDDPVLIMYSIVKKIEKAKNDPELSGTEKEEAVQKYQEQLKTYTEKYGVDTLFNLQNSNSQADIPETNQNSQEVIKPNEANEQQKNETINNKKVDNTDKNKESSEKKMKENKSNEKKGKEENDNKK
ncbi:type VII secretion protein EssB [Heyndrickxia sporothermodurans]